MPPRSRHARTRAASSFAAPPATAAPLVPAPPLPARAPDLGAALRARRAPFFAFPPLDTAMGSPATGVYYHERRQRRAGAPATEAQPAPALRPTSVRAAPPTAARPQLCTPRVPRYPLAPRVTHEACLGCAARVARPCVRARCVALLERPRDVTHIDLSIVGRERGDTCSLQHARAARCVHPLSPRRVYAMIRSYMSARDMCGACGTGERLRGACPYGCLECLYMHLAVLLAWPTIGGRPWLQAFAVRGRA